MLEQEEPLVMMGNQDPEDLAGFHNLFMAGFLVMPPPCSWLLFYCFFWYNTLHLLGMTMVAYTLDAELNNTEF